MRLRFASIIAALGLSASALQAQSYDFSMFSLNGQSFQNAVVGPMTLSSSNGVLFYTSSYGGGLFDGNGGASTITMAFSQGVSALSVRGGDGAGDYDAFGISFYEFGTNNFLGTFFTPQFGGPAEPEWYTLTTSGIGNIGRAVFNACNSAQCPGDPTGVGGVVITDITIRTSGTVVPEPSTVVLMLSGLAGIAVAARRRRRV